MGYPYSWHNSSNYGIKGPIPPSVNYGNSEYFYSGFSDNDDYKSLIRASIYRIMITDPGERVMLPEFGCNFKKYIFEPNDTISEIEIKTEITRAIERWEPRITIKDISMYSENHRLNVNVNYIINGTDMSDSFNYVFSLKDDVDG